MTMIIATHEMNFARKVGDQIVFVDQGTIIEEGEPEVVLRSPQSERLQRFLQTISGARKSDRPSSPWPSRRSELTGDRLVSRRVSGRDGARGRTTAFRYAFGRPPAGSAEAMVATSQLLATRAGLRALGRGGNAAHAPVA